MNLTLPRKLTQKNITSVVADRNDESACALAINNDGLSPWDGPHLVTVLGNNNPNSQNGLDMPLDLSDRRSDNDSNPNHNSEEPALTYSNTNNTNNNSDTMKDSDISANNASDFNASDAVEFKINPNNGTLIAVANNLDATALIDDTALEPNSIIDDTVLESNDQDIDANAEDDEDADKGNKDIDSINDNIETDSSSVENSSNVNSECPRVHW